VEGSKVQSTAAGPSSSEIARTRLASWTTFGGWIWRPVDTEKPGAQTHQELGGFHGVSATAQGLLRFGGGGRSVGRSGDGAKDSTDSVSNRPPSKKSTFGDEKKEILATLQLQLSKDNNEIEARGGRRPVENKSTRSEVLTGFRRPRKVRTGSATTASAWGGPATAPRAPRTPSATSRPKATLGDRN
jgi:hypothetical protein